MVSLNDIIIGIILILFTEPALQKAKLSVKINNVSQYIYLFTYSVNAISRLIGS